MAERPTRVALVGCGNIAGPYAATLAASPAVTLLGVTDLEPARAETLAAAHGCRAYPSLEALLADPAVEMVVNLTIHHAHHAITRQCLEAGKHVYSEKPLALRPEQARELVTLAEARGLRLGCSPFTWMGEAQQTAWAAIRAGKLGTVRVAYAEVNWGRIETWHPAPAPFYEVGALWDVGVYPITLLTTFFGPVRRVLAYGTVLFPDRTTKEGLPFHIETPDWVVSVLELADGTVVRLTTTFYVTPRGLQRGIEFHGDAGSLHLGSWQDFDAPVTFAPFGQPYEPLPLLREAAPIRWGFGAEEMALALQAGNPPRASGAQAAHVVEVLAAIADSIAVGGTVAVHSTFAAPAPLPWATGGEEAA